MTRIGPPPGATHIVRRVDDHDHVVNTAQSEEHGAFILAKYLRMLELQGQEPRAEDYEVVELT